MARSSILLALAALPLLVQADLPVHCVHHQVAGDWEFTLGPLTSKRSKCGHQSPDDPDKQPQMSLLANMGATTTAKFSLLEPDTVKGDDGSEGTWTMIYDEGFEVKSGDYTYFAFSGFSFVSDGEGGKMNISHCGQTQIGWYHDKDRSSWGCYSGKKLGKDPSAPTADAVPALAATEAATAAATADALGDATTAAPVAATAAPAAGKKLGLLSAQDSLSKFLEPDAPSSADEVAAAYTPWVPGSAGYTQPVDADWQRNVASALNFLQLGWSATAYEDKFAGKTPKDMNKNAGVRRHLVRPTKGSQLVQAGSTNISGAQSFLGISAHHRRLKGDKFDWRDKDGKNWLMPVVTQGDCGSCYTISTVGMLTARNKIRANDVNGPHFSVSFPLYCSEYNQGCDGGYGFLQSKWTEDVGLVPEQCAPFSQGGGKCEVTKNCDLGDKRYRGVNHHYVGGFYGASDEHNIKEELMNKGPLVMSFEPKEDFMYYKNGIYKSAPEKLHQEWEQVDHAVLLIGFGAASSQPFWTMQNSWGQDWGEAGFFRMARGSDESGCESIVVSTDVVEEDANTVLDDFISSL